MKHEYFENMEPESYPMIEQVQADVYNSEELFNDVELLQNWLLNWTGVFLHSVYHNFKDIRKYNSIYFCLLQSQSYQLEWVKFSTFSGQYDMTMRELRTIIENAFFHFKYDYCADYQNMSVKEKYDKMVSDAKSCPKETYGQLVFKKSGYKDWKNVYSKIFRELSHMFTQVLLVTMLYRLIQTALMPYWMCVLILNV